MRTAFHPASDASGLRTALLELMEESFVLGRIEHGLHGAAEATLERAFASVPRRTLTPGYYTFAQYLLWLNEHLRAGVPPPETMAAFEAIGLQLLAAARSEFEGNHPHCSQCGARQDNRTAMSCHGCGVEFVRKK